MIIGDSCRDALSQAASQLGDTVRWVDVKSRAREPREPYQKRPGDCDPDLIGG